MEYNPVDWIAANWLHILGWTAVLVFMKRCYTVVRKADEFFDGVLSTKSDVELIKSNHLPHLQSAIENVDRNITGLREDFREGFGRLTNSINVVLTRMV